MWTWDSKKRAFINLARVDAIFVQQEGTRIDVKCALNGRVYHLRRDNYGSRENIMEEIEEWVEKLVIRKPLKKKVESP